MNSRLYGCRGKIIRILLERTFFTNGMRRSREIAANDQKNRKDLKNNFSAPPAPISFVSERPASAVHIYASSRFFFSV